MSINLEKGNSLQTSVLSNSLSGFMDNIYRWMSAGLFITGIVAWLIGRDENLVMSIMGNDVIFILLIVVQFGLVIGLSAFIQKMSLQVAAGCFIAYSMLTGVTFSTLFLVYTKSSMASAFLITAGTFGAMSIYGAVTKRDLSGMGSFMFMGLVGLIIAFIVNIFMHSSMLDFIICCAGVIIFTGLTAWDTQKLLRIGNSVDMRNGEIVRRLEIVGALTLYLDFINLFLMILRLFGNRR